MRIMHVSDLHFHESSDGVSSKHRHALSCLRGIERLLEEEQPEYVVVSGDLTNIGSTISLERAYQWIHDQIYADGEYYGLKLSEKGITPIIVPGNHDAFNAPTGGADFKRWQTSLSNYYDVFHRYRWEDQSCGVGYQWADTAGTQILFCCVDSCYLGDPETANSLNTLSLSAVAKGRLSRKQSASILKLFDRGMRGELLDCHGVPIPTGDFLRSFKMLVMHHYLFEPANSRAEPLLHMKEKRTVFQNLAMSDFDVLLCGHKHVADVHVSAYSDNFDSRGQVRLAFNYVRRVLGIDSLPLRGGDDGRALGKFFRLVIGFLALSKTKGKPIDEKATREILTILETSLTNPIVLKEEMLKHMGTIDAESQVGLFDRQEIMELYEAIKDKFDRKEQGALKVAANGLRGIISRLSGRPFAHIMSASSAKASESGTRHRAVNVYDVTAGGDCPGHTFSIRRFSWDDRKHKFTEAFAQQIEFPSSRGLHTQVVESLVDSNE